jgi:hypothetical protein
MEGNIYFLRGHESAVFEGRKVLCQSPPEGGRNPSVCLPEGANIIVYRNTTFFKTKLAFKVSELTQVSK